MCEIHNEMQVQVVYNELTCDWVKSKVAVAWKVHHQSHLVLCEFFLVELENAFRICDKMQVIYKEMTHNEAKSKGAKWNLIGDTITQFSCRAIIGYVLIGLRTLFPWYLMESELFGMCIMSKRKEKTCFNLKMIQKVKCDPTIS